MVFKPFTHLARQSFAKTFTHGYAQSVVAATQSSYASSTNPFVPFGNHSSNRFAKPAPSQLHSVFHNASSSSSLGNKVSQGVQGANYSDGGLAAYYDAWQKQQQLGEKEWKQFQFAKTIEWKAPSLVEVKGKEEDDGLRLDGLRSRGGLDRAYSSSAVDEIKIAEDHRTNSVGIVQDDTTLANGFQDARESTFPVGAHNHTISLEPDVHITKPVSVEESEYDSRSTTSSDPAAIISDGATTPSNVSTSPLTQDEKSHVITKHINELHQSQRYADIPPAFQSMVSQGLRPSIKAYNALLAAAIHLPKDKHQVVPKALNVYADMLRRKMLPDTAFYMTLIQLLSRRAIDVSEMKASMDQKRARFGGLDENGRFLFRSHEAEYDILADDDALSNAVKLFDLSVSAAKPRAFSPETYQLLITACASHHRVDDMIRAYSHMESHAILPVATMFPPMIEAFAVSGDLSSAVECYNEYKSLAIADDSGKLAIIDRKDCEVYAAVVKAYALSGNPDGGRRFLAKVIDSFDSVTENKVRRLENIQDSIILDALIQERLDAGLLHDAMAIAEESNLTPFARGLAMARICAAAADKDATDLARKAYQFITPATTEISTAVLSMLALHVRQGNSDEAREYWTILKTFSGVETSLIEPTVMYAVALVGSGHVDEGLMEARQAFARIRSSAMAKLGNIGLAEEIDEGIELIGAFLARKEIVPSPHASMSFLWAMVENGGLVSPVAEQLLAGLSPKEFPSLSRQDMNLALQVQAEIVAKEKVTDNVEQSNRFAFLLESVISDGLPVDKRTSELVEHTLEKLVPERPDLRLRWEKYCGASMRQGYESANYTPKLGPAVTIPATFADSFDPYATSTDHRGSALIAEELENHRTAGLNEALLRFRNMRRAGRHPRYIIYAKLITSAAKEGRNNLAHDILGMARQDIPLVPQYPVVRHGWSAILDAMMGACLTIGNRRLAAQFHQELLDMGSAPTANTFGLYITTLKDSTKTFDEATEAVRIFLRAKSEGVEPSSFLYNALIGKLGKARRIDDCLFYFAEMRALGIRPTSVTYGTIVNALCRVSDEKFAEELFDEMESMPNYKPRPAPYNSLMQFFLTTKRDSAKVLAYYQRMQSKAILPTMHTYKLLIDTYATLDPINLAAAEGVLDTIRASGQRPEAVHYASLIHAKGCTLRDMAGARQVFDDVLAKGDIRPQACLYQALFESMVANHCVTDTEALLDHMSTQKVELTPYIANNLIHGWAMVQNITKSKAIYDSVGINKREPSTYEAMTRAFLTAEDREGAMGTVHEMLSRGYPSAVSSKILELLGQDSV